MNSHLFGPTHLPCTMSHLSWSFLTYKPIAILKSNGNYGCSLKKLGWILKSKFFINIDERKEVMKKARNICFALLNYTYVIHFNSFFYI